MIGAGGGCCNTVAGEGRHRRSGAQPTLGTPQAAAHSDTVDAVPRKVLRKPNFTWAEHGEALMRRRKSWYYEREPRPGISVIGARLSELVRR